MSSSTVCSREAPEAIAFYIQEGIRSDGWREVQLAYRLGIKEYQGRRTLQLVVEHMAPVTGNRPATGEQR